MNSAGRKFPVQDEAYEEVRLAMWLLKQPPLQQESAAEAAPSPLVLWAAQGGWELTVWLSLEHGVHRRLAGWRLDEVAWRHQQPATPHSADDLERLAMLGVLVEVRSGARLVSEHLRRLPSLDARPSPGRIVHDPWTWGTPARFIQELRTAQTARALGNLRERSDGVLEMFREPSLHGALLWLGAQPDCTGGPPTAAPDPGLREVHAWARGQGLLPSAVEAWLVPQKTELRVLGLRFDTKRLRRHPFAPLRELARRGVATPAGDGVRLDPPALRKLQIATDMVRPWPDTPTLRGLRERLAAVPAPPRRRRWWR